MARARSKARRASAATTPPFDPKLAKETLAEGGIGWFDGLAVATGAPNVDGAHKFIDYMIDPTFYVTWATTAGAPAITCAAVSMMSASTHPPETEPTMLSTPVRTPPAGLLAS